VSSLNRCFLKLFFGFFGGVSVSIFGRRRRRGGDFPAVGVGIVVGVGIGIGVGGGVGGGGGVRLGLP
jgi:hypothetical protein